MIERVNKDNLAEYEEFIKRHPKGLFQHSSKWAKVKSNWKWEAIMLKDKNGETDNKRAGNTRTGRTTNKKTENARTEKIRKSRRNSRQQNRF